MCLLKQKLYCKDRNTEMSPSVRSYQDSTQPYPQGVKWQVVYLSLHYSYVGSATPFPNMFSCFLTCHLFSLDVLLYICLSCCIGRGQSLYFYNININIIFIVGGVTVYVCRKACRRVIEVFLCHRYGLFLLIKSYWISAFGSDLLLQVITSLRQRPGFGCLIRYTIPPTGYH